MPVAVGDGSSAQDAQRVRIDRSNPAERYRFTCPNGHVNWDRTNNHIWCRQCRRAFEAGEDLDPEHYHIVDQQTGDEIPWGAVELAEDDRRRSRAD